MSLAHGELIAGAAAVGHGILTGWEGRGDIDREKLVNIVTASDVPQSWLPAVKDPAVQIGRAVQHVAGTSYLAKPVRKPKAVTGTDPVTWDSRWTLVTRPMANDAVIPGAKYGTVALVVTLYAGDTGPTLVFERNQSDERTLTLQDAVTTQFESRIAQQRYTAADVTKWLGDVLYRRLGAIRYGGNWYVPRESKDVAEQLLNTVRESGWGVNWLYPALPIMASPQLSLGLSIELAKEVDALMMQMNFAREAARENGREDIGGRACDGWQAKFGAVYDRITLRESQGLLVKEDADRAKSVVADALILIDSIRDAMPVAMSTEPASPDFSDVNDELSRFDIT